jgi:predicted nucleic acid-binding Zn ribbon protein
MWRVQLLHATRRATSAQAAQDADGEALMPLYVFFCMTCCITEERLQTGFQPVVPRCDGCGAWMQLEINASSIQYKGEGWAKSDRKKEGKK